MLSSPLAPPFPQKSMGTQYSSRHNVVALAGWGFPLQSRALIGASATRQRVRSLGVPLEAQWYYLGALFVYHLEDVQ